MPGADQVEGWVLSGRVDLLVARARRARRVGERRWLADAIERALLLADPGAVSPAVRAKAEELGADPLIARGQDPPVPSHAVRVPLVASGGLGFVRMIYVTAGDEAADVEESLSPEARSAVADALAAARGAVPDGVPATGHRMTAAQPGVLRALRIEGRSLGAAVFASAVALWSGRSVRPGTLVTGDVVGARVGAVGGLSAKIEGALAGRADVTRIVVPSRNAASVRAALAASGRALEVVPVADLPALTEAALLPEARRSSPEDAVARVRTAFVRGWEGYRWPTQREPLERLVEELPAGRPDLRVEALTLLGAVTRHLGEPERSRAVLERALEVLGSGEGRAAVPDAPITELYQHLALTERQLGRFAEAGRAARHAVRVARNARLRGELVKALGCAGIVALSRSRPERAADHQREALSLVLRHRPEGAPRTYGYLVEALGRAGDLRAARRAYRAGLALLAGEVSERRLASREAWLRTSMASALTRASRLRAAGEILDVACVRSAIAEAPLPGLLARRWRGLALTNGRDERRGYALLASSPVAYGRVTAPHVAFLAHLNVLFEARARLGRGTFGVDAAQRVSIALAALPGGTAGALLESARRAVERSLPGPSRGLDGALARLIDRCERLA